MAPMNLGDIPEDLVLEILTMLPVKALKRFRCVCQAWCDHFENPDFINKHCIKQTILKKESFFVNHYDETDDCNSVISIFESDGDEVLNFSETIRIPFSEVFLDDPLIIGSCNGIVCVSNNVENIGFWNPATREYKRLPPLIPSIEPPVVPVDVHSKWNLGFGFDRRTNDYKVLSFVVTYFETYDVAVDEAQLYSLKSDSWREIPSFPLFAGDVVRGSICFKGDCYWLAYRDDPAYNFEDTPYILSFNIADEKFEKFELPDFGLSINEYILELVMLNGTLAVILYTLPRPGRLFDIWVMEEYGVTESWVKKWSIEAISGLATISGLAWPLGFLRNYGVFFKDNGGQLVLYGKNSHVFKYRRLCGRLQVVKYVESLIPIDGRQ